jgi:peptidoglycan/xylan/chitin deacetylase (PgdA/CDA1 family)
VATPAVDPWRLSVTPAHFEEHLEVLKRRAPLLNIQELATDLRRGETPRRFLAVTFDDGYADNLYNARPLLKRHGVPATVFITSGWLDRTTPFWWDELQDLILLSESLPETLRLESAEGPWSYFAGPASAPVDTGRSLSRGWNASSGDAPTKRHAAYLAIHAFLSSQGPSECERGMKQLRAQIAPPPRAGEAGDSGRPMTAAEVADLARDGLVEIGAHGRTHARLVRLSAPDQRQEIVESRRHLEEIVHARVTSFAYPFGGAQDFTPETAAIVREEGFVAACATTRGAVRENADPWRLPRYHVVDSDGETLDRRISQWFAA